jgi:DMSO/TMAO reductase YedYZ molybdopterin-dependent catalytic subunit
MTHKNVLSSELTDHEVEQQIRRMSRRSFAWGAAASLAGAAGWVWLKTSPTEDGIPWPLRRVLVMNERLGRAYFKSSRIAPNLPLAAAREPRVNGRLGLSDGFNPAAWKLRVETLEGRSPSLNFALDDIIALPRFDIVTELKCIEGWSVPVHWAGARFSDFARKFRLATRDGTLPDLRQRPADLFDYAMLETPDRGYYVGLDIESALHPQTLLCYEMNGEPLTLEHGAPLRLVIPAKYGIKNIKRIGTIRFTDQRPGDYWAERGYDWYAGH